MDHIRPFGSKHRCEIVVGVAERQGLRARKCPAANRNDPPADLFYQMRVNPGNAAASHYCCTHSITSYVEQGCRPNSTKGHKRRSY
jgi:hypothetical protein